MRKAFVCFVPFRTIRVSDCLDEQCTIHKFERLHTQQREAERQAEHLFQTLLHRAFQGELQVELDWLSIDLRWIVE